MKGLILLGYEFLSVLCPALIFIGAAYLRKRQTGALLARRYACLLLVFAVYLFGVFYFTGASTVFDAMRYGLPRPQEVNLIPFSDPDLDIVGYGLNVLLFLPLGFLLPMLWSTFSKLGPTVLSGLSLSLLVEISQLFNHRRTDVDDLILNTAGALLGFYLFRLCARVTKRPAGADASRWEATAYIGFLFLFRFLTFHEFGAAKLLYGF